jgi:hypothetical protein
MATKWQEADLLSDDIMAAINRSLTRMRASGNIDITQLVVGCCCGLMALNNTAPTTSSPTSYVEMMAAIKNVLHELSSHHHNESESEYEPFLREDGSN